MDWPPWRVTDLSSRRLRQKDPIETMANAPGESGLAPERLILELTEAALIDSIPANNVTPTGLATIGSRLSFDVFGTGYSSLGLDEALSTQPLKDCPNREDQR